MKKNFDDGGSSGPFQDGGASFGPEEMELRLWEYIDGLSKPEERSAIEQMLVAHAEWRAKYNELLAMHHMLETTELEQPSLRFTRNVMDEIAHFQIAPATRNYINKNIIWGIAAFFITVIAGFLIYGFSQIDWSAGNSNTGLNGIDFNQVDYGRMFNNTFVNAFMMMNILLGLMLLDKYLAQRKNEWKQT